MTLTTHGLVGATIGTLFARNPELAIPLAYASHYALDAIPHWAYTLTSYRRNKDNPLKNDIVLGREFAHDIIKIGMDGILGLALPLILLRAITPASAWLIALSACAGMLPDLLQFVYFKFRHEPMIMLQKIHDTFHSKNRELDGKPTIGILLQIAFVLGVLMIARGI